MIKISKNAMRALADSGIRPIADRQIGCWQKVGIKLPSKFIISNGTLACPGSIRTKDDGLITDWAQHPGTFTSKRSK